MYNKIFKRFIDVILSLLLIPIFIIFTIILKLLIFMEDKGPTFYISYRMGKNGKKFRMIKYRSMKYNAEDIRNKDGSTYNSEDDQRVTRIGKIIRKTSIDELPQIINVLLGSMSFIGPRPVMTDKLISDYNSNHRKRFDVRPGITGYSQAYFRNSISADDKFNYDVYYVENLSLLFDIKILFKTIKEVLTKKNIYKKKDDIK